ncbi:DUF2806 domain-containing protein [Rhizobium sp. CCGE 510]|uniref:DUF2806 domain-containing protein n=1 Tax=Rhizobium sp. CCGE 510 TaxID=1132836 RepID=UPI00027B8E62|nr:DUF2806 domain-containing protein [Rhizobium sp. CCGE 510]EJT04002.1 hypothetical protein RCCGE510_16569 [Rhizobium sp. CCGE 510]
MGNERGSDKGVGLTAKWSWSGFSARVQSRTIDALDYLGAIKAKEGNIEAEREVRIQEALTDAQVSAIEAAGQRFAKEAGKDLGFAERILNSVSKGQRKQDNVNATAAFALEDLQNRAADVNDSDAKVSAAFLSKLEHYAEGATTEQLREKWGRVLAAEIRKPGTFSNKVLRVVDEMEAPVAELFQSICAFAISLEDIPLISLGRKLSYNELSTLIHADVLADYNPAAGLIVTFNRELTSDDASYYADLGPFGMKVSYTPGATLPLPGDDPWIYHQPNDFPRMSCYSTTDAGRALMAIMDIDYLGNLQRIAAIVQSPSVICELYRQLPDGTRIRA